MTSFMKLGLSIERKNVRMVRLIIGEVHVCALYAMTSVIITQCTKNIVNIKKRSVKMQKLSSIQENLMKNLGI